MMNIVLKPYLFQKKTDHGNVVTFVILFVCAMFFCLSCGTYLNILASCQ